jgi:hypothetical protein
VELTWLLARVTDRCLLTLMQPCLTVVGCEPDASTGRFDVGLSSAAPLTDSAARAASTGIRELRAELPPLARADGLGSCLLTYE